MNYWVLMEIVCITVLTGGMLIFLINEFKEDKQFKKEINEKH